MPVQFVIFYGAGEVAKAMLLLYPPGSEFVQAFIAWVKLGALLVPVPPPEASGFSGSIEKLALVAANSDAAVALTSCSYIVSAR